MAGITENTYDFFIIKKTQRTQLHTRVMQDGCLLLFQNNQNQGFTSAFTQQRGAIVLVWPFRSLTLRGSDKARRSCDLHGEDRVFWAHMLNVNICAVKGQGFHFRLSENQDKIFPLEDLAHHFGWINTCADHLHLGGSRLLSLPRASHPTQRFVRPKGQAAS